MEANDARVSIEENSEIFLPPHLSVIEVSGTEIASAAKKSLDLFV